MEQLNYNLSQMYQTASLPSVPILPRGSDDRLKSLLGECGFDRSMPAPPSDFSFFDPTLQTTLEGQKEADNLLRIVREWISPRTAPILWILLQAGVGVGKTALLRSCVWQLRFAGIPAYYITAHEFDNRIKDFQSAATDITSGVHTHPDEWLQRLSSVPVLVIDDIGAGVRDSPYVLSRFERLFDHRYQHRLPTAASTNLTSERFVTTVGERVSSRFGDHSLSKIVELLYCEDVRPLLA